MKIIVDFDLCEANALCVGAAPEVFNLDDEDNLHVLIEQPAQARRAEVEEAVRLCPRAAITLVED